MRHQLSDNWSMCSRRPLQTQILFAVFLILCGCTGSRQEARQAARRVEQAPPVYRVSFETSRGLFTVEVTRKWAPRGADRFYELVNARFYDGSRFFRVVPRSVAQFGINGDPATNSLWNQMRIPDDPVHESNQKGTLSFAMNGPATRTTQVFINLADNKYLDSAGFAPFGKVISGIDVPGQLYRGYGDWPPRGSGPSEERVQREGNGYLERYFPRLDYIKKVAIEK